MKLYLDLVKVDVTLNTIEFEASTFDEGDVFGFDCSTTFIVYANFVSKEFQPNFGFRFVLALPILVLTLAVLRHFSERIEPAARASDILFAKSSTFTGKPFLLDFHFAVSFPTKA